MFSWLLAMFADAGDPANKGWKPPDTPDFYGLQDSVQGWLDANFGGYLEQNPGLIQANRLLGGAAAGFAPTGAMFDYGAATAPTGWVLCDGATYDGTNPTYLNLWSVIGTSWGGTGQASFKVPDSQGRMTVGYAASGGHADVSTLGNNDAVALANRRPKHNHTNSLSSGSHSHTFGTTGSGSPVVTSISSGVRGTTSSPDSGVAVSWVTGSVSVSVSGTTGSASPGVSGTIGPSGTNPSDAPAYIVVTKIIKL